MKVGDIVTVSATATYNDANVGTVKPITVVYTVGGKDAFKYTAPAATLMNTGVITAAPLALMGDAVVDPKVYDGSTAATFSSQPTVLGVIGSDVVTVNTKGVFTDTHVGINKQVTITYSLSGAMAANYSLTRSTATATADITARPVTFYSPDIRKEKVYDGTTTVRVTGYHSIGVIYSDWVNLRPIEVGTYDNANVGTGKSINVEFIFTGENTADYYIVPHLFTVHDGSITPAPITGISNITGTATMGEVLTAGKTLTPAAATISYKWQIASTSDGAFTDIPGATGTTYIPVAADATKFVRVVATGTGNYSGTATSAVTTAITSQ